MRDNDPTHGLSPESPETLYAPNYVYRDHRILGWGIDEHDLQQVRAIRQGLKDLAPDASYQKPHIRVGARGILIRIALSGTRDGGAFENPFISVIEVHEDGRLVSNDTYDIEDHARAFERFAELSAPAGSQVPAANRATRLIARFEAAWDARDWEAITSTCAPDMRQIDRRDLMHLELSRAEHLESLRFSYEMASSRFTTEVLETRGDRLALVRTRLSLSNADVGPSEIEFLSIWETNESGTLRLFTRFNARDLDAASTELNARAAALSAQGSSKDPSAPYEIVVPPNAASRWVDRFRPVFKARDWNAIEDFFSPEVHYEDRQRHSLVSGGYEVTMASVRARADSGAQQEDAQILATAGERHVLLRSLLAGGSGDSRFETEFLCLQEVDEAGRLVTNINFDLDDRAAAHTELFERFIDSSADAFAEPYRKLTNARNRHDLERARAVMLDDFFIEDHRRTGYGQIEGADAYIPAMAAAFDLSPDVRWDALFRIVEGTRGFVNVTRMWGTNSEGGSFESIFLALYWFEGDRIRCADLYELDAREEALARFAELEGSVGR